MKHLLLICFAGVMLFARQTKETPTQFSEEALQDTFITLDGESISFASILKKYEGKTIFIEVWASWCKDCLEGMPKVKELQQQNKDVVYLFLSLDKSIESWKKGIKKYEVQGEHYFMQSGWKGNFGKFLNLDWIPRYLVVDQNQNIILYKATKATDENIKKALKK